MTRAQPFAQRVAMPDIARFLGMFLVYYGHVAEQFMYLGDVPAGAYYKFIYSFHMPFFFVLAGFVANPARLDLGLRAFAARTAASRLVPYAFFTVLMLASTFFFTGWFPSGAAGGPENYLGGLVMTLRGIPAFNIPTWFMALLVSTEVLHWLVGRFLTGNRSLVLAMVLFYLGGWWLNSEVQFLFRPDGLNLNFWIANEAPAMYAFYLLGVFMRRRNFLLGPTPRPALLAAVAFLLIAVLLTFNLNQGPWRLIPAVVILLGAHGHIFWFAFTAVAGSVMLLALAKAWEGCGWAAWMGKNALTLFCLNGVFYHYVNPRFAKWCLETFEPAWWSTALCCLGLTVVSLALCVPVVVVLTRRLPQLVGRPYERGPILPRLVNK